jgi:cell division septation protein DedD
MIKIEVTGNSIPEVADKLLAIGASLRASTAGLPIANGGTGAQTLEEVMEVAEAAPVDPTPISSPATATSTTQSSEPAPKSVEPATVTESQPTTTEPSSTPAPAASASEELNFDTDVAPYVLQVVKEKGKPVAQEILSQFGVEKASLLDPTLWPELVQQLKDAL